MADRNTDINKQIEEYRRQIADRYMTMFECDLPDIVMCQSMDDYYDWLLEAIERGKPITDEDYDEKFPSYDENGNEIWY